MSRRRHPNPNQTDLFSREQLEQRIARAKVVIVPPEAHETASKKVTRRALDPTAIDRLRDGAKPDSISRMLSGVANVEHREAYVRASVLTFEFWGRTSGGTTWSGAKRALAWTCRRAIIFVMTTSLGVIPTGLEPRCKYERTTWGSICLKP
jgi:hypothetical protein